MVVGRFTSSHPYLFKEGKEDPGETGSGQKGTKVGTLHLERFKPEYGVVSLVGPRGPAIINTCVTYPRLHYVFFFFSKFFSYLKRGDLDNFLSCLEIVGPY